MPRARMGRARFTTKEKTAMNRNSTSHGPVSKLEKFVWHQLAEVLASVELGLHYNILQANTDSGLVEWTVVVESFLPFGQVASLLDGCFCEDVQVVALRRVRRCKFTLTLHVDMQAFAAAQAQLVEVAS